MTELYDKQITGRSAWTGADLRGEDWLWTLTGDERAEIAAALDRVKAEGRALEQIAPRDFPLPSLAGKIAALLEEVREGRGFAVLRGLPLDGWSEDDAFTAFWGLGRYFGKPISQDSYGAVLGHVYDRGVKMGEGRVRGYQTSQNLRFHTDRADMTILLCLRRALRGGRSSLVSSHAIHNRILAQRPDYLPPFYEGYPVIHVEEGGHSEPRRIPVFSVADGVLSCGIQRNTVETALRANALPVSDTARDALALFDSLAEDPAMRLDMDLQPGDLQFCNNYTVMHARTDYEDDPDPAKKRHMVRLWLAFDEPRPIAPHFADYNGIPKELDRH